MGSGCWIKLWTNWKELQFVRRDWQVSILTKINLQRNWFWIMMLFFTSRGQFAVVKKCIEISTGGVYAAKIIRKRRVARGVAVADIGKE